MTQLQVTQIMLPLMGLYLAITVLIASGFFLLWRKKRLPIYRTMVWTYASGIGGLLGSVAAMDQPHFVRVLGFCVLTPYYLGMALVLAELVDLSLQWRRFLMLLFAALAAAYLLDLAGSPRWLTMGIGTAATGAPAAYIGARAILIRWKRLSTLFRSFAALLLFNGLFALDYTIAYADPIHMIVGFTFGVMCAVAFAVLVLGALLENAALDKARLELEVAYQAKLSQTARLVALGEVAGGVAHEINNPLAIIQTAVSQMLELLSEKPVDESLLKPMCETVDRTVTRIAEIVKGLRASSRDGSADPMQPENVRSIVDGALALCRDTAHLQGVEITVEGAPDVVVPCRATQVSQVLLNLFGNALDAMAKSKVKRLAVSVRSGGEHVEIAVQDSGPGIPDELKERIFQAFFTTKEVGKGTGLGLSISKSIAEAHGGKLDCESSPAGTRFILVLPKTQLATA